MHVDLDAERDWARRWLADAALPLWWERGADRSHGGYHDQLDQAGHPVDCPKRARVQARQAYVYAEAGRLGWSGPWREATAHGLDCLRHAFRRDDGLFRAAVARDGTPVRDAPDLYDQAFVLLALAAAYRALDRPPALLREAETLLDTLDARLRHPDGGFEEARPRILPLRSNPQMHLLEATLAWIEAGGGPAFAQHARALVALACARLIDPASGAIGEIFDGGWRAAPGACEPGHQFEWAYLLALADRLLGGDHSAIATRLYGFGLRHGLCDGRVIALTDADGTIVDRSSRLWAQTERLRTTLTLVPAGTAPEAHTAAAESIATIRRFCDVPVRGLWRDRTDDRGVPIDAPAPASSLYHLWTGLMSLLATTRGDAGLSAPSDLARSA